MYRVGSGHDRHRLVAGRKLWIGGVDIPAPVGEEAHSDGDVLLHALTDALLGAIGAGDIGELFPDTDPRWKDTASPVFLAAAAQRVVEKGYRLVNVDATVFLQEIRLSRHKPAISARLRELLGEYWTLDADAVNVKAKTAERCDAVGEGRAIDAQVTVLLVRVARS
jgi:2-C-methyl-D-erythritol 2,4-cyclodiphosphate synthase